MRLSQVGFIFDWDGVVVDSSSIHEKSWNALARELDLELPENHFQEGFGKRNSFIIPQILKWTNSPSKIEKWGKRKEELYREFGSAEGIQLTCGIRPFLNKLKENKIPAVIGTSTERKNIELAFDQLGLADFFHGAICSEDVSKGKPSPEVFLKGADVLRKSSANCVVFEDSPHGIKAAKSAGMKAVGLTTSQSEKVMHEAGAEIIVPSPQFLRLDSILELFD